MQGKKGRVTTGRIVVRQVVFRSQNELRERLAEQSMVFRLLTLEWCIWRDSIENAEQLVSHITANDACITAHTSRGEQHFCTFNSVWLLIPKDA